MWTETRESVLDRPYEATAAEQRQQRLSLEKEFGPEFLDVIVINFNRHGTGKVGFRCMFGGVETKGDGETLQSFAKRAYGSGVLKPINKYRVAVLRRNEHERIGGEVGG